MRKKIYYLILCSFMLVFASVFFGYSNEQEVVSASSNDTNEIIIEFDYNTSRIDKHFSNQTKNLNKAIVIIDAPSVVIEPRSVSISILRFYYYDWTIDGEIINLNTYEFSTSTKVVAVWTPIDYTVYYNYTTQREKSEITNLREIDYYNIENPITYYRPRREGYAFVNWYSSPKFLESEYQVNSNNSLGDKYLYAKFKPIEYTINYNTDAYNIDNPPVYTIESPDFVWYSPQKEGYNFEGWYLDSNFVYSTYKLTKGTTGNLNLYPKFTPKTYMVTYHLPDGSTQDVNVLYGTRADSPNINKSIFQVVTYDKSIKNVTEDMSVNVKLVNIWYVYLIAIILIALVIFAIVYYSKNKYKKMHKLRYVYQVNSRNRRKK